MPGEPRYDNEYEKTEKQIDKTDLDQYNLDQKLREKGLI